MAAFLSPLKTRLKLFRRFGRKARSYLPELNFITLHYLYFIVTTLVSAGIIYGSSTPSHSVQFVDALFLAVSAMTEAGLNTINLSTLNTFQQVVLFFLIIAGSAIFVSAFVVHIRRRAFEKVFQNLLEHERTPSHIIDETVQAQQESRDQDAVQPTVPEDDVLRNTDNQGSALGLPLREFRSAPGLALNLDGSQETKPTDLSTRADDATLVRHSLSVERTLDGARHDHISFGADTRFHHDSGSQIRRVLTFSGVGARPPSRTRSPLTMHSDVRLKFHHSIHRHENRDLASAASVSRNSTFHHLTEADRLRLGGKEYRAVTFLSWVVPIYFFSWQLLGCLGLGAYVSNNYASTTRVNGLNPWWVGVFNAVSAFNNSGMSLLDANMTVFNRAIYMLLTMGLLILAGNTCFPVFLRLIVWSFYKLLPKAQKWDEFRGTLKFLLDHPRRCYTNMFPSEHTWWLFLSVIILNGIDCAAFAILNIGNNAIDDLPPGIEFIDGLFQAFAVRSGGFYVVPISTVRISLQVLYVIMMYISAFPVAITIRNSNVYEERSLGIYSDDPGYEAYEIERKTAKSWILRRFGWSRGPEHKQYFLQQQLRAQLAHDLWWLALAVFFIMVVEGSQFQEDPGVFSVFNVLFEVVSGYGTVGISVGLPNQAYSFCGSWHALSKLILCAVMLRGRHRGLPVAIDKAVLLPNERLHELEEEDAHIRADRRSFV
ncbi:uncharacterized protein PV09_00708 [Verruconis gallopava]|uniref:Potassium transport protein n=1 Tax=Verruconis gallopava TaxID=253628 RepID=A0A0D2AQG9_9PEZI|nr:uncharacterized protein PV09_00708 [Verruconis gallopava]KIW08770.1 hypothetical protein PV09_00708 [Verruconis gallopava]